MVAFATQYHEPDLFPIGFSGFNFTGYWTNEGQPYDSGYYNSWLMEESLLVRTQCNCIGFAPASHYYYIDNALDANQYDFYNRVCRKSGIYMVENSMCFLQCDSSYSNIQWESFFKIYYTDSGIVYPDTADWDTNTCWNLQSSTAAKYYYDYFDSTEVFGVEPDYFWGYDPFVEGPNYRYDKTSKKYVPREYGANRRITDTLRYYETKSGNPFDNKRRMIMAQGQFFPLFAENQRSGSDVNIFAEVPEIDAFFLYCGGFYGCDPYGSQARLDSLLYGQYAKQQGEFVFLKGRGSHNTAIYMQCYGNTGDKDRRWIAGIPLQWQFLCLAGTEKVLRRRPCPPEIRCVTYLVLSRGAKGIFYSPYLSEKNRTTCDSTVPNTFPPHTKPILQWEELSSGVGAKSLGLRDRSSRPCEEGAGAYLLSTTPGSSVWHCEKDTTFDYLCTLIPEIKAITPTLMQLDWVNAYSLKSTSSQWEKPGSHTYVKDITTNREGYIDLAFFDSTGSSSEYFMVVNRDDIDSMRSATLIITLDGTCWPAQRLLLTDMGDSASVANPDTLNRSGTVFVDTVVFEPGEGKLFRINNLSGPGIYKPLTLWGLWKESRYSTGYMDTLSGSSSLGWALYQWRWLKDKPATLLSTYTLKKTCDEDEEDYVNIHGACPEIDESSSYWRMEDSCMNFVTIGDHPDGKDTLETHQRTWIGTESNRITIRHPDSPPAGCPDLYSFFYEDTSVSPGHVFMENNTILPHSQHYQAIDEDLLKLDVLNTEPDHYYLSIVENDDEISYLDQVKLWVVDHDADEQVATSADDSIYCYSDLVGPASCKDQGNNDKLDEILWEDTVSFAGPANSYLTVKFSDPGWSNAGLLISLGDRSETAPPPKDYLSIPSEPGGGGTWDSLGVAYGRMNPSQWLVDVSDCDSLTFRVYCGGSDTCFIDRIALVKLEPSGWSLTEAVLDSAVQYAPNGTFEYVTSRLFLADTFIVDLAEDEQISLRFDKVDTSTTYSLRDFVFQSRGYYYSPLLQKSGIEEVPLEFGLEVQQIAPLSRTAFINYSVPYSIHVKIGVYDVAGRLVKAIVNEKVMPGKYCEEWQGKDNVGRTLASGVYFVKMMTEDFEKTDKIVILE
jgi:hypothetical protein